MVDRRQQVEDRVVVQSGDASSKRLKKTKKTQFGSEIATKIEQEYCDAVNKNGDRTLISRGLPVLMVLWINIIGSSGVRDKS